MFKDAAIGGAGGILMDVIMGQVNQYLPASFQTNKTTLGVGDALKAGLTAVLGTMGARLTKGLSVKMAEGALAIQAYEILSGLLPATMTLGYMSPAAVVRGSNRVGPTRAGSTGFGAYQPRSQGNPALLNGRVGAYVGPGRSMLLNRMGNAQQREGVSTYK